MREGKDELHLGADCMSEYCTLSTFKYSQTSSLPVDSVAPKLSLLQKHVYSVLAVNIVT